VNKEQALHAFWSSFGIPAYDEQTVPDNAKMPYITYRVVTDSFENTVNLTGSIWYRSTSWVDVSNKSAEIAKAVGEHGFRMSKVNGGYLWIVKGTPFAQRMSDPEDDMIRRIYINLQGEFLTAY
jgi:hypothetical protein